jgi:hypothetical protein
MVPRVLACPEIGCRFRFNSARIPSQLEPIAQHPPGDPDAPLPPGAAARVSRADRGTARELYVGTPTDPSDAPPPVPGDLALRAVAVRVDLRTGTATVLDRPASAPAGGGASFALLGANEIGAAIPQSSVFRSAVGQFIPKKVRIRFDVALTNRSSVALLPPSFPPPPAGTSSVMLFPFATTLTGGNGAMTIMIQPAQRAVASPAMRRRRGAPFSRTSNQIWRNWAARSNISSG